MATVVPKLSSAGAVKIRFTSLDLGTTRWKEGTFEILEKDNKVNLCLRFNCGGASKTFQVFYCFFLCFTVFTVVYKTPKNVLLSHWSLLLSFFLLMS